MSDNPDDVNAKLDELDERTRVLEQKLRGLNGMTLAEIEAMADRLGTAARTIRDAQALLGGAAPRGNQALVDADPDDNGALSPPPRPVASDDAIAAHRRRQMQPVEARRPWMLDVDLESLTPAERARAERGGSQLTPAEQAEKRRKQLAPPPEPVDDPDLPEEIRAMERGE